MTKPAKIKQKIIAIKSKKKIQKRKLKKIKKEKKKSQKKK